MHLDKNQKVLFLTNIESGLEHILQEVSDIRPENMLTIQNYGPVTLNSYGDIMRSVIIAIHQENVKEIFVVAEDKRDASENSLSNLNSIKDQIRKSDDDVQNSMAEFLDGTVDDWLTGKENVSENIKNCVDIISNHSLVPSNVKVQGLIVNNENGKFSVADILEYSN
ncbi:carbonic anhydrase [Paraliobacillus quinghaiensis]|nr:carbonic anhydrase [Paraliobacillus quinghaiensis]